MQLRQQIICDIKGYQKNYSKKWLRKLTTLHLLRLSHPLDRLQYARKAETLGLITKQELTNLETNGTRIND